MTDTLDFEVSDPLFPCPYCGSAAVHVIGQGRVFVHYHCDDCRETWTGARFNDTRPPTHTHRVDRKRVVVH
jgi:transposase-like protein